MNKTGYRKWLLVILASVIITNELTAQPAGTEDIKNTADWYNSHVWMNGLKLQPHSTINKQEFARQYRAHKIWWDKAFKYLKETDFTNLKVGEYPIDGDNVFAKITETTLRDAGKKGVWESHPDYADIHYVLSGKENIGIVIIPKAYDVRRDSSSYGDKGKFYAADTGVFFIIFSTDAHRPDLKIEGHDVVRKLVIKVRTD